jgi:hypothetical protein
MPYATRTPAESSEPSAATMMTMICEAAAVAYLIVVMIISSITIITLSTFLILKLNSVATSWSSTATIPPKRPKLLPKLLIEFS